MALTPASQSRNMLQRMKPVIDALSPEAIAKREGFEAFFHLIGVGGCPYGKVTAPKAHWLAGWLEGFSGQHVDVHLDTDITRRGKADLPQ